MIRTEFLSRPVQAEKYRDNVLWLFIEEYPKALYKNGSHILHGKKSNFCQRTRQTLFPLSLRDHVCLPYLRYNSRISFPFLFCYSLSIFYLFFFLSILFFLSFHFSPFFQFFSFFFFLFCKIPGHNWFIDVARFSCMFYRHLITIKNIFFRIP